MYDAPVKFETICRDHKERNVLLKQEYEAISAIEAESRAFLNCVKEGGDRSTIAVTVRRAG